MAEDTVHVTFEEFASHLSAFLDRVIKAHETVVVEDERGAQVEVRPLRPSGRRSRLRQAADYEAFAAAAGTWSDVDTDALLQTIYESRRVPGLVLHPLS